LNQRDAELRVLGVTWLGEISEPSSGGSHPYQWKDAWEIQWDNAAGNLASRDILARKAMAWLAAYDLDQKGWTSVWSTLWEHSDTDHSIPRGDLVGLGQGWLDQADAVHPRWAPVWLKLWDVAQLTDRAVLTSRGRGWILGTGKRIQWHLVWIELWKFPQLRDDTFREAARSRLHQLNAADRRKIEQLLSDE
jgi:hypothetical protein